MKKLLICAFSCLYLHSAPINIIKSQPEILFEYKNLKESQSKIELNIEFNKAVALMKDKKYIEAIEAFEKTISFIEVPSYLNIAIAYYNLQEYDNAKLYFEKIYQNPENVYDESYAYMSACYYLYQIGDDDKYLDSIMSTVKKVQTVDEQTKTLLVDTLIILKQYEKALEVQNSISYENEFKKALLYLKVGDFEQADIYLDRADLKTLNPELKEKILWFKIYSNLKTGKISRLNDNLSHLEQDRARFRANYEFPFYLVVNKQKLTNKEYLQKLQYFDEDRNSDFIFYFAPYIFSDTQEIIFDTAKGFIAKNSTSLNRLGNMLKYNNELLKYIKEDPIIRVYKLSQLVKTNSKSYELYNLGLAYAQIFDFHNAYKYFSKAYMLNPGNKLFASMTLLSAKRINKEISEKKYIESNILKNDGLYNYFGQMVYKLGIRQSAQVELENKEGIYYDSIFAKSMEFLDLMQKEKSIPQNSRLLDEHSKDPVVYILSMLKQKDGENEFQYISRLQDRFPIQYNNNFLQGPLIITEFYIDALKSIGMLAHANFDIYDNKNPTYLRTKAIKEIYLGDPKEAIDILEKIQYTYDLEDKYTFYLLVAAYLQASMPNEAILNISLIKSLLKDPNADYLTGVLLINELKLSSISQYFKQAFNDPLIDIELSGFEEYLKNY